jgi:hypothetical protein
MSKKPKKPERQARTGTLRIRLTDAERATLDEAAGKKELETSTWARAELLQLARRILGEK